ncbi:ABC-F family ATP-binding cassette domain-containing protein [Virgibacillus soli]|uniref:ABC-F family ATP-binding cassette domain-containing protein n=1 Tax=Paracerasibacillus soli TaxID=480284 RepID=A0ABU5CVU0_9BACI|nr:ABC-F family ATP-binding cassette domain-containing protein [Virgibacillus soli]MDY0410488.1 ABC-F family ATP-binding cassette domain-containing protein [Virgibacillus soli]
MILMQLTGISKSFGAEEILNNIKLEIKDRDRIAIVGRNGAGKSTLLKIMAHQETYDVGDIFQTKQLTIGYLSQHTELESEKTIWNEMIDVFEPLIAQEKELRAVEQKMADAHHLSQGEYEKLLASYDQLQHTYDENGGYTYEAEIRSVLNGLHFQDYEDDTSITELSGGQKTRLALGKLLLSKPQLLILDEPTNHLDIETLAWLEGYLTNYPGAVVIVSHDRYFLDKTVNIVYEISRHTIKKYYGTYSKYLELRAQEYEQELKEYEKQQTEIKKMEDFIQRNIVRASTTKRAQSRRKQLEKMDVLDRPLGDEASATFTFEINKRSGNDVLQVTDVAFGYDDSSALLFKHISLRVERGNRIAIVGPNGIGKTTLLKVITGKLAQNKGTIQLGTNVQIGYYDQELADLSSNKTVLQELWDEYPTVMEKDIRTMLGNFLFSGDDVLKPVHSLSGGEKARLALAKLRMQKANLLILDEPTNHLDIDSKEVLESALLDFPGTIIFVSHDRYFINKIADHIFEMDTDSTEFYLGDYDYYVDKKQEQMELKQLEETSTQNDLQESRKQNFQEEKRRQSEIRKIERQIMKVEETIEELETTHEMLELDMTKPEIFQDHERALALTKEVEQVKLQLDTKMKEWEMLQEQLSAF